MNTFDYSRDYKAIDFRQQPELYQIGKGEQGVLLVEPYKSEILPYWRFKDPDVARQSSEKIYEMFLSYLEENDFVGADMARKFIQMGYTRARRYVNHKGGKKYVSNPQKEPTKEAEKAARQQQLPRQEDPVKAAAALIFKEKWEQCKANEKYQQLMQRHRNQ